MSKLEAIRRMQLAFEHSAIFKKDFRDYIELSILEELENNKINIPTDKEIKFVKDASAHIVRLLFDTDWWSAQGLK